MTGRNTEAAQHSRHGDDGRRNNHYDVTCNTLDEEFYNMDHKYRGKALIFSHDEYDIKSVDPRPGNKKDWKRLLKCLEDLSFSVTVFHNPKYEEIMVHIKKTAAMDHSENDCLLIAVLTHGKSHGFLWARDTSYGAKELWCGFTDKNCPTLAGKPKLFIIQACQGDQYDPGVKLRNRTEADSSFKADSSFEANKVPFHRDFLLALSSVPGYLSWRHRARGAWFIQALCKELESAATTETDFLTLLTYVTQEVASDEKPDKICTVPYFSSLLTRRLVLTKKADSLISHRDGPLTRSDRPLTRAGSNSSTSSRKQSLFGYFGACLGY